MTDIVATIQAEQDRIIRSDLNRALVVQGGPGTGKTAVALHRAAYLLYTHRRKLERSGVLVIGPSTTFLHYIDQVLPSLGETASSAAPSPTSSRASRRPRRTRRSPPSSRETVAWRRSWPTPSRCANGFRRTCPPCT